MAKEIEVRFDNVVTYTITCDTQLKAESFWAKCKDAVWKAIDDYIKANLAGSGQINIRMTKV